MSRPSLHLLLAFFLTTAVFSITAQEVATYRSEFSFWGFDGTLGLKPLSLTADIKPAAWVSDPDLALSLGTDAGWSSFNFWRDPATDNEVTDGDPGQAKATLLSLSWKAGLVQGLFGNDGPSPFKAFLYYKGLGSLILFPEAYLANSDRPDKNGMVQNSFLTGLSFEAGPKLNGHGLRNFFLAEASFEAAPEALQSVPVDFLRANTTEIANVILFDVDPLSKGNVLSLLAADYFAADQLWGQNIPILAQESVGGLHSLVTLGRGNLVEGVDDGRFDGNLKVMNNFDLRLNLPALTFLDGLRPNSPSAFPGLIGYFDAGYYAQVPGLAPGYLASTGYGVFLNLFGIGYLALYEDFWLNGTPFAPQLFRFAGGVRF